MTQIEFGDFQGGQDTIIDERLIVRVDVVRAIDSGQCEAAEQSGVHSVIDATVAAWGENQRSRPDEAPKLRQEIQQIDRKIEKLLDQLETDDPIPEIRERLKARRHEKEQAERALQKLESAPKAPVEPPTAKWVRAALAQLAESLKGEPNLAREAIRELLAGPIVVQEIESSGQKRKTLRGTFSLPPTKTVEAIANWHRAEVPETSPVQDDDANESITIDFRETPPNNSKREPSTSTTQLVAI